MNIALECPTPLLEAVQPLADFDWILSHLVEADPTYAKWYQLSTRMKVLDNSVNELLEPVSIEKMTGAANIVNPTFIVAPDFLGDWEKTLSALEEAMGVFGRDRTLPVLQGSTLEECKACARDIKAMGFRRISIPYDILSERYFTLRRMGENRSSVLHHLGAHFSWIHLLGFTSPSELLDYVDRKNILSQDTGKPIMWGLRGDSMHLDDLYEESQGDPTLNKMELRVDFSHRDLWRVYRNLADYRRMTYGTGGSLRQGI